MAALTDWAVVRVAARERRLIAQTRVATVLEARLHFLGELIAAKELMVRLAIRVLQEEGRRGDG